MYRRATKAALCFYLALSACDTVAAQDADAYFHRGYYLHYAQGDVEAALIEYEKALDAGASSDVRKRIRAQIDAIQEQIAARDLAKLMPADTLAFVEMARPAEHLERLLRSMGLVDHEPSGERVVLPLDDGVSLPSDFQVSPRLLAEMKKVRGLAIGITGINFEHEHPEGVAIIHTGSSDLLGGLVDTGVQVIPQSDDLSGFDCYRLGNEGWLAKTPSMCIMSTDRDAIAGVCQRLKSPSDSLLNNERFAECKYERAESLVFAFVDVPLALKKYGSLMQGEAAIARTILGLDQVQHLTASIGATDRGAAAQIRAKFKENQQSLAYGFIRTVPLNDSTLSRIPAGSAVVAALGINPKMGMLAAASDAPKQITGLDIGRELFANIREVGLFVRPTAASEEVPDFGFAFTAHDAKKSEQLWTQLLALPAEIEDSGIQSESWKVAGHDARRYTIDDEDMPPIVVMRMDDETMLVGTEGAVQAAAIGEGSVMTDEEISDLVKSRSDHTCKAIFVDISRALELASHFEDDEEIKVMERVLSDSHVSILSEESDDEFALRLEISGLPLFEDIVKTAAAMQSSSHRVAQRDGE